MTNNFGCPEQPQTWEDAQAEAREREIRAAGFQIYIALITSHHTLHEREARAMKMRAMNFARIWEER